MKTDFRIVRSALAGAQAVEACTRHVFARHCHEQYGVGLILQGGQKSASGRGMVESMAGDIITVNPGEVHDGAPIGGSARAWRMLYFDPALVGAAAHDLSEAKSTGYEFRLPSTTNAALAACFSRLYAAVTAGGAGDAAALLREQSLLELLHGLKTDAAPGERKDLALIRHARALIDDDPAAAVTLEDLARVSGLSRFQLVRQFARATGLTPHAYLVQRRIEHARRMIAGGTGLAEAAAACGFADQSHMTRIFIRKYGITPGAYAAALS